MVTTVQDLPGFVAVRNVGVVRGLTVRSRSAIGNFVGGIEMIFGGNIVTYATMCEKARVDAFDLMCEHAVELGANAIVGMRYDATELMGELTEVLCYGTAIFVEPL